MTIRTDTLAAVRPVPYFLEIGRLQTIACPVRHGSLGSLQAPTVAGSSITIEKPDGTDLVSADPVAVPSSTAEYDVTPGSAETQGEGWTVVWQLLIGGVLYDYRYDAYLCDYVPHCPISVLDLFAREPELRGRVPQAQSDRDGGDSTGWQPQVDLVYYELLQRLLDDGRQPWLIRGMHGARRWMIPRAIEICYRAIDPTGQKYADKVKDAMWEAKNARADLKFQFTSDPAGIRRGVSPIIRLMPVGR